MDGVESCDCTSVASWTAHCALLRPSGVPVFRLSYLFQCLFNDFPPLLLPALRNSVFGVDSSTPNHPSLYCSNIVLVEVTSVEQKWACWHFVKPCLRPSICFVLNWVDLWGWPRLWNWAVALIHVWLMGLHSNSLFLVGGTDSALSSVRHLKERKEL